MKNTKLIALVAVLVVVGVIVSVAITNSTAANNQAEVDKQLSDYQTTIDALNATIEKLNQGLIDADTAMKELADKGVELQNWTNATAQLPAKLEALKKAAEDFVASTVVYKEDGKTVLVSFNDKYAYVVGEEGKEGYYNSLTVFQTLYVEAQQDLLRATSVDEMDSIVKGLTASYKAIPTMLQKLYTALEAAEKNGVEYTDYDNIVLAYDLYNTHIKNDNIYAPAAEGEKKGEKDLIGDRIDALMDDFKPLVVANFVKLVKALPTVEQYAPSHEEALKAATKELDFVKALYDNKLDGLMKTSKGKETDFAKALTTYNKVNARAAYVHNTIVVRAERVNEKLKNALTSKNEYGFDMTKFGANIETYTYIYETLVDDITWWENTCDIITDTKDEDYNAELHGLVNYDVYEGYVAKFEAAIATLKAAADEFIAAVEAIENVNLNSKATLDAAKVLFDTVSKGQKIADLDKILGLNDYLDDEDELVEVTGIADSYDAWLTQYARFNWLVNAKKNLEDAVKATEVKCVAEHKDADGKVIACDGKGACATVGTLDYKLFDMTKVAGIDADILVILVEYELDETVFDAELLTVYKMARLQTILAEVTANLTDAYEASTKNAKAQALKGIIEEEIKAVAANYTFAAEFTCEDPDNDDHKCECAKDLDNWAIVIENEPATALAEKYTTAILADRFAKAQ